MTDNGELHVVFGTGAVGMSVMDELVQRGPRRVRMVNRSGRARVPHGVEVVGGDATDEAFTREASEGASVVYFALNPPYNKWPVETIGNYDRGFNQENPRTDITVLCGEELEKWMLKTTCGMVAARQTARDGVSYNSNISEIWVSILSGQASWPALWGLYAAVPTGVAYHSSSFSFRPLAHPETGQVLATEMILNGVLFYLLLGRPDFPSAWGMYRPRTLVFEQDDIQKFIEISWLDPRFNDYIRFSRVGKYDGSPPDWPPWAQDG